MTRARSCSVVWLAVIALIFAALAPSISQALSARKGIDVWAEICTVTGAKFIKLTDVHNNVDHVDGASVPASSDAPADQTQHFEHCPYCFTHGLTTALPPAIGWALPLPSGQTSLPPLFYQAPRRALFVWAPAQARAPPALS